MQALPELTKPNETRFVCSECHKEIELQKSGGTGYGSDPVTGLKVCYACCGLRDAQEMRSTGKACLYLTSTNGASKLTNWPGTLTIHPYRMTIGRHNIAGKRFDVWFSFEGQKWHGVQYGENTQICHCKRVK